MVKQIWTSYSLCWNKRFYKNLHFDVIKKKRIFSMCYWNKHDLLRFRQKKKDLISGICSKCALNLFSFHIAFSFLLLSPLLKQTLLISLGCSTLRTITVFRSKTLSRHLAINSACQASFLHRLARHKFTRLSTHTKPTCSRKVLKRLWNQVYVP